MSKKCIKNFTRPLCSLILCLVIAISIFTISAFAADTDFDNEYHKFYLNDDGTELSDELGTYKAYPLPVGYSLSDIREYRYANPVICDNPDFSDRYVYTPYQGSGIYWLDNAFFAEAVYMSDEAYSHALPFFNGTYESLDLRDEATRRSSLEGDILTSLKAGSEEKSYDVRELKGLTIYEIVGFDSTGSLMTTIAAIYEHGTDYIFIDYSALGNNYFNADGSFSYRGGTVEGKILNDGMKEKISAAVSELEYPDYSYTYEDEFELNLGDFPPVFFWLIVVILCIVIPLVPTVFGIVFPISLRKKATHNIQNFGENCDTPRDITTIVEGKPKKKHSFSPWHAVSIAGAVWLTLGIAIILVLLLG